MPRVAVLFRTYQWDDFAFRSAVRTLRQAEGTDFYVLADETGREPFDTGPLPKIAHHEEDFPPRGLPASKPGGATLWWNCDYGLYDALLKRPHYDYYVAAEDDVSVNVPLLPLVEDMRQRGLEAIVTTGPNPIGRWPHGPSLDETPYARKGWGALSVVAFSGPCLRLLLAERRRLGRELVAGRMKVWPFCEGFVVSALLSHEIPCAGLREFVGMRYFGSEKVLHENDRRTRLPGSMAHSVLDPERFAVKFRQRAYYVMLGSADYDELRRARDGLLRAGRAELSGWRIRRPEGNLALDKPATQSSVSGSSRNMLPGLEVAAAEGDARGGNSGVLTGGYGFHTEIEDAPWWQVDLETAADIAELRLFNRRESPERARRLSVLASEDALEWRRVWQKTDDRVFVGHDDPLICRFPPGTRARYVRVMLDRRDWFHLDEIEVISAAAER